MITAETLKLYCDKSSDDGEANRLKSGFAVLKKERVPFYLTGEDFDKILKWKLRGQYGRQFQRRQDNTDEIVKSVTKLGLNICHESKDYELELKLKILTVLHGVEIPVASAVMALVYPEEYAVIDKLNWCVLYDENRTSFTVNQYKKYLSDIKSFAERLKRYPQEVDLAIWAYAQKNKIFCDRLSKIE